jgi:hypothetical protein
VFKIEPTAFYSKEDFVAGLEGTGVDIDYFLTRLQCIKKFRGLWWGEDVIHAFRNTTPLAGKDKKALPEIPKRMRKKAGGDLIGGIFNPTELGIRNISGD